MERPEPRLIRTFQDAEVAAADWLRFYGFDDVVVSGMPGDGGVDVRGLDVVAQVKAEVGKVGRPVVQQLHGIASFEHRKAALFALGGYTNEAVTWADSAGVALFVFDLTGEPGPSNHHAIEMVIATRRDPVALRLRESIRRLNEAMSGLEEAMTVERDLTIESLRLGRLAEKVKSQKVDLSRFWDHMTEKLDRQGAYLKADRTRIEAKGRTVEFMGAVEEAAEEVMGVVEQIHDPRTAQFASEVVDRAYLLIDSYDL